MITWFHCFWACGEAERHGGECVVEQSYLPHGRWEAESKRGRGNVHNISSSRHAPVTYFLQAGSS
jgi:hypothetical protein